MKAIVLLLPRLRLVHSQRQRCGAHIEALLDELQAAGEEDDNQGSHSTEPISQLNSARRGNEQAREPRRRSATRF